MQATRTAIADVFLLEPRVFGDERGFFFESFNARAFAEATGADVQFVQDNHSKSAKHVLRGLHYQSVQAQGKLVRVTAGAVFDLWHLGWRDPVRREPPAALDTGRAGPWLPGGFRNRRIFVQNHRLLCTGP